MSWGLVAQDKDLKQDSEIVNLRAESRPTRAINTHYTQTKEWILLTACSTVRTLVEAADMLTLTVFDAGNKSPFPRFKDDRIVEQAVFIGDIDSTMSSFTRCEGPKYRPDRCL